MPHNKVFFYEHDQLDLKVSQFFFQTRISKSGFPNQGFQNHGHIQQKFSKTTIKAA